jgi:hypothetical protein
MVKDVYGSKYEQNIHAKRSVPFARALLLSHPSVFRVSAKLEELDRQNIDLATFQKFAESHQALLYPAFEMQTRFHDQVLGTNFWQILIENRVRMFNDRYISVADILARYEERIDLNHVTHYRDEIAEHR